MAATTSAPSNSAAPRRRSGARSLFWPRHSAQLRAMLAMAGALTATLDMEDLLQRSLRWALGVSGLDQGSIMLTDRARRRLIIRAVIGHDAARVGRALRVTENSVAGWVLRHRAHLHLQGNGESFPGQPRTYTKDIPAAVVLPLLTTKGTVLGVLSLNAIRESVSLSDEDIEVLQAIANLVAIAIDDAAMYRDLQAKEQALQAAARQLVRAQEEERKRVAYDIHDGLAQMIAGTYQRLQAFRAYRSPRSAGAQAELAQVQAQLKQSIDEARRIIADLRPSGLDDFGLELALRQYLAERQRQAGWELTIDIDLDGVVLTPHVETTVFRIVQEAATNALKHAGAGRLAVRVACGQGRLTVDVTDSGCGFRVRGKRQTAGSGVGLVSMADRAAVLGGACRVRSRLGQGTAVHVELPVAAAA